MMGLGFLAPLFFAGAALIVVPWIVHRIGRPERDVVRFSSLMFVPDVRGEVVERRRVQHLLLMLLRMLLLALLAIAFTRPYREMWAAAEGPAHGARRHVILLDTSLSMATTGHMEEAKKRALEILDGLPKADRAGVITFARTASVGSPLFHPDGDDIGSIAHAERAIDRAQATWEATDYAAGLQAAERLLLAGGHDSTGVSPIVHLISDFQETGMPPDALGWRLSPGIAFVPIAVGMGDRENHAIQDLTVREVKAGELQVRARIKNWSHAHGRPTRVGLVIDGVDVEALTLTIPAGNASQAHFTVAWDGAGTLEGYVEIGEDALPGDNRRYFAWNPARRHPVLLVGSGKADRPWPYHRLIEAAVPADAGLPWKLIPVSPETVREHLGAPGAAPEIVIAADLNGMGDGLKSALEGYIRSGGSLFLPLRAGADTGALNRLLHGSFGLRAAGLRFAAARESIFEQLSWVNLSHPIFRPFRGPRFNDFSSLRFYNYHRLVLDAADSNADAAVLARFEGDGSGDEFPAIVDVAFGDGRILIWAGGLDLNGSNLTRSPRFVPLLHETLRYLSRSRGDTPAYTVGDAMSLPMQAQRVPPPWEVEVPARHGKRERLTLDSQAAGGMRMEAPGLYRWRRKSGDGRERVEAVNVYAAESDPTPVPLSEFEIRLCDTSVSLRETGPDGGTPGGGVEQPAARREYGRIALGLLFGFLLLENIYAARLGPKPGKKLF